MKLKNYRRKRGKDLKVMIQMRVSLIGKIIIIFLLIIHRFTNRIIGKNAQNNYVIKIFSGICAPIKILK